MADKDTGGTAPVIDELLCFVQSKIGLLDVDLIVKLCEENFDIKIIEKSKEILFDLCHSEHDKTERKGRIGEHKSDRNLRDIYNLLQEKGASAPPFCARDLNILPPVTFKSVDVSILLHTIRQLQTEVKILKDASEVQRQTTQDLYDTTKSLDARVREVESPNSQGVITVPDNDADNTQGTKTLLNPQAVHFTAGQQPKPTYAHMAQFNSAKTPNNSFIVDSDGYIVVGPNGKPVKPVSMFPQRKNSLVIQKSSTQGMVGNSTRSGLEAATRYVKASVFVSRYQPGTTAEEVKEDLMLDPRVKDLDIKVETVQTRYDTYTSFHVTCVCKELEAKVFLGPDLWPNGILYRQWKENRQRNAQGTNDPNQQGTNGSTGQGNGGSNNNFIYRSGGYHRQRRGSV